MKIYIDLAYSAVKVESPYKEFSFPTEIKAPANNGAGLNRDGVKTYEHDGRCFVVAQPRVSGHVIHNRDFGFLIDHAPLLVAYALEHCEIHLGSITALQIAIPFENCDGGKDQQRMTERLSHFVINGCEYRFAVECVPQGVGVFLEYLHTAKPTNTDECGYVLDFGYNTVLMVKYENLEPRYHGSIQMEQYGISRVVDKVAGSLHSKFGVTRPLIECNTLVRNRTLKHCGETHDISAICELAVREYLDQIFNEIFDKNASKFADVDRLVIGGGGAYYITEACIPDRFRKMVHFMTDKPEFANVRGFKWYDEYLNNKEKAA